MEKINFQVTPWAQEKLLELRDKEKPLLVVRVRGGGCSGLLYEMSFHPLTYVGNTYETFPFGDLIVAIDRMYGPYLNGITLDYDGSLNGKGFEFYNPKATKTCGCGQSFGV